MALYKEVSLTNQGVELLNDLTSSDKTLEFTNMKATSKKYVDSEVRETYVLEDVKQSTSIYKQKRVSGRTTRVESLFSNEELETSYQIQTIGVYAKDIHGEEILFGISISEEPFFMYSHNEGMPTSANFTLHVGIGEAKLATLERSPSGLASLSDVLKIEEDVKANEFVREEDELARKSAESERVTNEEERISKESERIESEVARKEEMEKARYSRFSNYTYDEIGERLDTIESNTFTSHIFDDSGAPGPKRLIRGNEDAGFYGFVQPYEFGTIEGNVVGREEMSASNLALALGITQGIAQNDDTSWMKFHRDGHILFHPVKPLRNRISWNDIYAAGAVYGDGTVGVNPQNGRVGIAISVDGSNNAFVIEQISDHWLRGGAVVANVGDKIVVRGFSNAANNGEFIVQSITDYQIVVDKGLVTEEGNKKASVYNKKDAVTQNASVTIGDNIYDVLLFKGADHDPLDSFSDDDRDLVGPNSDWNALILPLHEQAKVGDWAYKSYVGEVDDWGIGLTDKTLVTHHTFGEGTYKWMQEAGNSQSSSRLVRGNYGASFGAVSASWGIGPIYSWAPVLRLKQ